MNRPRFNRRLVLFVVTFSLILWVLWQARTTLTPFIAGLIIAYLISPLVNRVHHALPAHVQRRPFARPIAILAVYLLGLFIVTSAVSFLVPPIITQATQLIQNAPALYNQAQNLSVQLIDEYQRLLTPEMQTMILDAFNASNLQQVGLTVLRGVQRGTMATLGAVSNTVSWLVALLVIPIWLFYILNDTGRVLNGALGLIPRDIRPDAEAIRIIFDKVLSAYIRGQLFVALILGTMMTAALMVLGVPYSLLLGFAAGALAVIPFLGSILGALPAVVVAFLQSPELAIKTILAFVVIQQIDNLFISPRVQGDSVALNPAIIMVVLVVGQAVFGPVGLLAAVPFTAILRDVVHYLYLRVGEEPIRPAEALARIGYGDNLTPMVEMVPQPERPAIPV